MQVSSPSSLTWLQSASGAASQTGSAASTDGQDLLDASGAEGSSPSSLMASLQSPSQQFSAGSLSALISAQLDQASASATSTDATSSAATQPGETQSDATQGQPSGALVRHHHHHGGGGGGGGGAEPSATQPASSATTTDASAASSTSDAETEMAQLLTGM